RHSCTVSRYALLACLTFVTLVAVGCMHKINESDLVGRYEAVYPFGKETLTLEADGKYVQGFVEKGSTDVGSAKGSWHYEPVYGGVVVQDALVIDYDPIDVPKQRATRFSGSRSLKVYSRSQLSINPDLGYYFRRLHER